jgi:DUF971 family protein
MTAKEAWPTELRLESGGRTLVVAFDDGASFRLPSEHLRVRSPSAEVQGHSAATRKTVGGKRNVAITDVTPVGNYAARIDFDDGHTTGIYTWRFLRELGATMAEDFAAYERELAAKKLHRDRPGEA